MGRYDRDDDDDDDERMSDVDARNKDDVSEEEYDENADEDFSPDQAAADEGASSSSDNDEDERPAKTVKKSKKRQADRANQGLDIGSELDSGDESTIEKRRSKKRRKDAPEEVESGGEGGFVRTRAQRIAEKEERKHRKRARDGEVTVDVNQLWADLSSMPIGRVVMSAPHLDPDAMDTVHPDIHESAAPAEDTIIIKRRIEYAGSVEEVEETVPRGSKEAQRYLAEHPEADPNHRMHDVDASGLQKPLKRPSMFEPNPVGLVKGVAPEKLRPRAPTRMDVLMAQKREEARKNAQKMSTVQKSALDWRGFVDQEGLRDELDEYGKSKRGYLAREAFLDRAAGAREQAARDARLKL